MDLTEALEKVKILLKSNRIICDDSDEFLVRFVKVSNGDPQKTYDLILCYLKVKKDYPDEFMFEPPSHYEHLISRIDLGFIRRRVDRDGRPMLFLRFGNIDPSKESWSLLMQSATMLLECLSFESEIQESGICLVVDCTKFSLKIMKWATPYKMKAVLKFFQECVPVRFDVIHVVNAPFTFRIFYAAVSPFVASYLLHKIVWHERPFQSLLSILGPSNTPIHLGGDLDLAEVGNWYQEIAIDKEPIFQKGCLRTSTQSTRSKRESRGQGLIRMVPFTNPLTRVKLDPIFNIQYCIPDEDDEAESARIDTSRERRINKNVIDE